MSTIEEDILSRTAFKPLSEVVCACLISVSTLSSLLIKSSYFPNKSLENFSAKSPEEVSTAFAKSCFTAYRSTFKSLTLFIYSLCSSITSVFNTIPPIFQQCNYYTTFHPHITIKLSILHKVL